MKTLLAFFLLTLVACNETPVDSKRVKQEMAERKVFHITDDELLQAAQKVGVRETAKLDSILESALEDGGRETCVAILKPYQQQLEKRTGIRAQRVAFGREETYAGSPKEKEVLAALAYYYANGKPIPENVQKLEGNRNFQYVRGQAVTTTACLRCHQQRLGKMNMLVQNRQPGMWVLYIPTKPAALQASVGKNGM